MAKFLPFVVEKSTPMHIFQTLIQRSKGMNQVLVASTFYLVLTNGITKIREAASDIPDTDLDHVYEMLLTKFPNYRVSTSDYTRFKYIIPHVQNWYPDTITAELNGYDDNDKAIFFLGLALCERTSEYTSLPFDRIIKGEDEKVFSNLNKYNLFDSTEDEYYFSCIDDLRAYISTRTVLKPDNYDAVPKPVKAIYSPPKKKDRKSKKSKPHNDGAFEAGFDFSADKNYQRKKKEVGSYKQQYESQPHPGIPNWAHELQKQDPIKFNRVVKEFEEYKRFGGDPAKDPQEFFMKRFAGPPGRYNHDRKAFPEGSDPFDWKP